MSWDTATLGELAARDGGLVQTGPFGSQLHESEYQSEGIPVIMPKDIADGRVSVESIARVSEETAARLKRHQIKRRDIVLPRRGAITKRAFIREDQEGWLCGTGCLKIELRGNQLIPEYLYYYLDQPQVVQWLEQNAVGTTMLNLSTKIVSKLPVRFPNPATQVTIATILAGYDDLIENNRRRMALLEEAARQLYREWFVCLRFPGHEHTRIVDGVPEGWERKTLGAIAQTNAESHKARSLPDEINYIDISSVAQGRIVAKTPMPSSESPGRARRIARDGDIIWSNVRPNLRAYALVLEPEDNDVFSTGFTILTSKSVPFSFLYLLVTMDQFVTYLVNHATGASYPAVRPDDFDRAEVLVPVEKLLKEFHAATEPIFRLALKLERQNERLRAARDLLLPRLMSGEIAV